MNGEGGGGGRSRQTRKKKWKITHEKRAQWDCSMILNCGLAPSGRAWRGRGELMRRNEIEEGKGGDCCTGKAAAPES